MPQKEDKDHLHQHWFLWNLIMFLPDMYWLILQIMKLRPLNMIDIQNGCDHRKELGAIHSPGFIWKWKGGLIWSTDSEKSINYLYCASIKLTEESLFYNSIEEQLLECFCFYSFVSFLFFAVVSNLIPRQVEVGLRKICFDPVCFKTAAWCCPAPYQTGLPYIIRTLKYNRK